MDDNPTMAAARRRLAEQNEAKDLVAALARMANGMSREQADALSNALAVEHPTLLGQIAKAVAVGVMRRATYDPTYKPYGTYERSCFGTGDAPKPKHADHDGRLSCDTVIGAELMAHQSFV